MNILTKEQMIRLIQAGFEPAAIIVKNPDDGSDVSALSWRLEMFADVDEAAVTLVQYPHWWEARVHAHTDEESDVLGSVWDETHHNPWIALAKLECRLRDGFCCVSAQVTSCLASRLRSVLLEKEVVA